MEAFVVLLPLFGAMLSMPVGRAFGPRAAEILTTSIMGLAAIYAWILFFDVAIGGNARTIPLYTWIGSGGFQADWAVRLDTLSAVMLIVINSVSFLVHMYSIRVNKMSQQLYPRLHEEAFLQVYTETVSFQYFEYGL